MSDIPPTPWLERLGALAAAKPADLDAEAVHDLRVAAGRLRVWLALSGFRALQDDLRWLRRAAATLRDLDVVLERHGSRTWAKELGARRELLAEELAATLAGPRVQGLVAALRVLPPLPEKRAHKRIDELKARVGRDGDRARRDDDLEPIHRLRRDVRKLRYAVEWRGGECSRLEDLQDALGEVGDLATAQRMLAEIGAVDGAPADRAEVETELARQRERSVSEWKRARRAVEDL